MENKNFITITNSNVEILQKALQYFSENYPIVNQQYIYLVFLRKLYSLQVLFKKNGKELYIQK